MLPPGGFLLLEETAAARRPSLQWNAPIASAVALSERLAGWQLLRHGFYSARPTGLSLRGPKGAVAISQYPVELQESYRRNRRCLPEIATSACGLLAMTNPGTCAVDGVRGNLQMCMALRERRYRRNRVGTFYRRSVPIVRSSPVFLSAGQGNCSMTGATNSRARLPAPVCCRKTTFSSCRPVSGGQVKLPISGLPRTTAS